MNSTFASSGSASLDLHATRLHRRSSPVSQLAAECLEQFSSVPAAR
jgi:hypothetical protein